MPQDVALAKAPVPVLRKGRVIRNLAIETETAKPRVIPTASAADSTGIPKIGLI
jgi:hypothetical protein